MKRYYIYFLLHPLLLYPIYVGQSVAPRLRYQQHLEDGRKYTLGMQPFMVVVGMYRDKSQCDHHENVWVDHLLHRWRMPLRNIALTRLDTSAPLFFWLVPMVRAFWLGKFGIVR